MEAIYYTVAAIVLYVVSDKILDGIERTSGRRFEHRTLIFFAILLTLALASFAVIRRVLGQ